MFFFCILFYCNIKGKQEKILGIIILLQTFLIENIFFSFLFLHFSRGFSQLEINEYHVKITQKILLYVTQ